MDDTRAPHSAEHLTASERDFWWNADFVALIGRRANLAAARRVLDVGCGVGHWTRTLLPELSPEATVVGVDPEAAWVEAARQHALPARVTFQRATAEALPFPDGAFDLVTCQTVLIHVRDATVALAEMLRVLRPGGTLLLAEPSNLGAALLLDSTPRSVRERVALAELQAICEAGKAAVGEGNNSIGDLLPGLVAALGVTDLRVYQSDRTCTVVPPYADAAQQASIAQLLELAATDRWIWDRAETRRYFLAGGGAAEAFDASWALAMAATHAIARAIEQRTYHAAGGGPHYLIVATKPQAGRPPQH